MINMPVHDIFKPENANFYTIKHACPRFKWMPVHNIAMPVHGLRFKGGC